MADVELLHTPPAREPTFFKPLDAASRRRSRASHDSAAASTRSWVIMNQQSPPPPAEPIPVPDPVPALVPTPTSRPLPTPPRRTSAVGDEAGPEYMTVEMPTDAEAEAGYQWATGRGAKAHAHKGFVGGFVSGLRRLPRALVRPRTRPRRGTLHTEAETEDTEGTGMTGNTLPRYVSNPTTPVVPSPTMGFARRGMNERENVDAGRRPRHPSFRVVPPADDVMQQDPMPIGDDAQQGRGDVEAGPSVLDFPQTPLENPYDRDATSIHVPTAAPSPRPSRADDRLTVPLADGDTDEPASVQVHPLPTEDYRRMSAADAAQPQSRTTITSVLSSFSADSPSFSSELNNGPQRFLNALHVLPWVATNRVTTDYVPKAKPRPLVSWYHPVGEGEAAVAQYARALDANAATSSASPETARPRHRTPQQHRRATTLPELPASAPPTYGVPLAYYPAFSPSPSPSPPPPPTRHQPSPPPQPRRRAHRHHHRRSASPTYHPSHTQALSMPMPAPAWAPLPAPPAPVYIIRATPPSSVHATPGSAHSSPAVHSASPPAHGSPRSDASAPKQMLVAPVYMQMQVSPGAPHQLAFVHGGGGDVRYPYGYAPYGYAYSGGSGGEAGSPIAMPPPVQTVGG
ncbi:hypothetical protein DFH08DRAFT_323867 [Mycena albidolilacea]|uniref:Uncharacterized protein n=1 Tax=Mycena albidolilacea TaxID=1033008 RepID=A0AAD7F0G7_9AGAR|nr:hypothetical protein DFH08DRAFT_323867 [Mycena albidolilacea]